MTNLLSPHLPQPQPHAVLCLRDLLDKISAGGKPAFAGAFRALEGLPLGTEEFALTRNRLRNAQAYFEAGELGAACYELRLLVRHLANA